MQKEIALPVLQSSQATSVSSNGASGTVTVVSNGGAEITDRGICWANNSGPTINNNVVRYGSGSGSFNWTLSGLNPGTQYFVRTFATNKAGTNHGNEISFSTEATVAVITTSALSAVTSGGATGGGNISSDGGSAIIARGVCWSTSQNPLITGSKTNEGSGTGSYVSIITGLLPGTTYYVRAYVTNGIGTSYGNELNFKTLAIAPSLTTAEISLITSSGAQSGGNITDDGGGTITSKGVCWSTNQNPTTGDSKTSDANVTLLGANPFSSAGTESVPINQNAPAGSFVSAITGLSPGVTYYARAYAVNAVGTSYGSQKSFTTTIQPATLTTSATTALTSSSAVSGGTILSEGGSSVTSRGVCWSTSQNPTTSNSKTTDGNGTGSFVSNIAALDPGTTYFARAYAVNGAGTEYGNQIQFTTLAVLPTLSTSSISDISATGATSGGLISNNGGANVTSRGICWSTSQNPTTSNSKTTDGSGTGSFTSTITGLSPGVTYYVRAYAVNSVGTAYGNQVSFTSGLVVPVVTTNAITNITSSSASGGGNVTDAGGATVTARGICWSTSQNPTTSNSKTTEGSGTGSFTSSLTGLDPGTTYYVRAYATNSAGTSYGNQISFLTKGLVDIDGNSYYIVTIGTQVWMAENLKTTKYNDGVSIPVITDKTEWSNLTTPGCCWFNNTPSYKELYGALYNGFAVSTGRLCPSNWHVPTDLEWTTLSNILGGVGEAGGKLKEIGTLHWMSPNTGATNSSGFTALPSGFRCNLGNFLASGSYEYWWSSTEYNINQNWYRNVINNSSSLYSGYCTKEPGLSVRCIKN